MNLFFVRISLLFMVPIAAIGIVIIGLFVDIFDIGRSLRSMMAQAEITWRG